MTGTGTEIPDGPNNRPSAVSGVNHAPRVTGVRAGETDNGLEGLTKTPGLDTEGTREEPALSRTELTVGSDRELLSATRGAKLLVVAEDAFNRKGQRTSAAEFLEYLAGEARDRGQWSSGQGVDFHCERSWVKVEGLGHEAQVSVQGRPLNLIILKGDGNAPEVIDRLRAYTEQLDLDTATDVYSVIGECTGGFRFRPESTVSESVKRPGFVKELDLPVMLVRSPHDMERKQAAQKAKNEGSGGDTDTAEPLMRSLPGRVSDRYRDCAATMVHSGILRNVSTEKPWRTQIEGFRDPASVLESRMTAVWPDQSRAAFERVLQNGQTMGGVEAVIMGCPHYDQYDVDMAARLDTPRVQRAVESIVRSIEHARELGAPLNKVTVVNAGPDILDRPVMRDNFHPRLWEAIPDTPDNAHLRSALKTRRRDFGPRTDVQVREVLQHSYDLTVRQFVEPMKREFEKRGIDIEVNVVSFSDYMGADIALQAEIFAQSPDVAELTRAVFEDRRERYEFYAAQEYEPGLRRTVGNAALYFGMARAVSQKPASVILDIEVDPEFWRELRAGVESFTGGALPANYLLPGNAREPWGCERWG